MKMAPLKIKLFFNEESDTLYSELFLNIDVKKNRIHLAEKDPSYRQSIVQSLENGTDTTSFQKQIIRTAPIDTPKSSRDPERQTSGSSVPTQ
jgi:hypothetical protein